MIDVTFMGGLRIGYRLMKDTGIVKIQCLFYVNLQIEGRYKARDYAIITVFLNCGLRISELIGIKS